MILVAIPCLYGGWHTKLAIDSVIHEPGVEVLLIDNGAAQDVKDVIALYPSAHLIRNPDNIYVNPAWNQAMEFFLEDSRYTHIVLMNSDLVMGKTWASILRVRIEKHGIMEVALPTIRDAHPGNPYNGYDTNAQTVTSGFPGVFICLSYWHVKWVYPIPSYIKVWFGDNWIFDKVRAAGVRTSVVPNLFARHLHGGSQNVQRVPGIAEIIEEDKRQWEEVVQPMMIDRTIQGG